MFKRLVVLTAAAAALAAAPAAEAGSTRAVTLGSRPADITLTVGQPSTPDNTILVHLEGLINRADAGSEIAISVFRMTDNGRIEEALKDARGRGVRVYVVYDPSDNVNNGYGDWPVAPSTLRECDDGCLSRDNHASGTKMHAKFALFSSTNRASGAPATKATWISSSNLNAGSGTEMYNDSVTYYGESEMYTHLAKVFNDMSFGPAVATDYYRPELGDGFGRFSAEDAVTVGYVSPEQQTNIWYDRLGQVRAPNEGGGTCTVRVMQAFFLDDLLDETDGNANHTPAYELRDLKNRGCSVAVLVHHEADGTPQIGSQTKAILCNAGISVRSRFNIHNKLVLTSSGLWYGPPNSGNYPMVFTGSHNMTENALRSNDELLAQIYGSQPAYDIYNNYFLTAWSTSVGECSWN